VPGLSQAAHGKFAAIQEAFIAMFPPPPVAGLGTIGGFKLQIEDRAGLGYDALNDATKAFIVKASAAPELAGLFSSYQVNVPQLYADIDRTRRGSSACPSPACSIPCRSISARSTSTISTSLDATYSVRVQADAKFRARADDVGLLKVRSDTARWCRCRRC